MTERKPTSVRSIAWTEICPWLVLFKTFRLAVSFRSLALGAVAAFIMSFGWSVIAHVFPVAESPATLWLKPYADCPWQASYQPVEEYPDFSAVSGMGVTRWSAVYASSESNNPFFFSWQKLTMPFHQILADRIGWGDLICLGLCALWSLAVWAFFGGAISRFAAVQLAAHERITCFSSLRYAKSRYLSYLFAPLLPAAGIALTAAPIALVGLFLHGPGILVGALVWPLLLVFGMILTLLFIGLLFGWPLMWSAVSTEGTDSFDAVSRAFAYVYQRPLQYLFFAAIASFFGFLCWMLVANFAALVVWLTYWAAAWGSGNSSVEAIMSGSGAEGLTYAGIWLIRFWTGCVKLLAVGFGFSYFWTATEAIYLLLRRQVDSTEMDEVHLEGECDVKACTLPKIFPDSKGAPTVEDEVKTPAAPSEVKAEEPVAAAEPSSLAPETETSSASEQTPQVPEPEKPAE